jgi:large subunit ribosomal protein L13
VSTTTTTTITAIYDAENQKLGRFGSVIAKKLLNGENIIVVNAEKAVVSGSRTYNIEFYHERIKRGNPIKGPFYPRTPDGMLRRAIRGMLPLKKPKGRDAYKRLRVYTGVPDELKNKTEEFKKIELADAAGYRAKNITLGELSLALGAKKRW